LSSAAALLTVANRLPRKAAAVVFPPIDLYRPELASIRLILNL
jgi:hypothetical protein